MSKKPNLNPALQAQIKPIQRNLREWISMLRHAEDRHGLADDLADLSHWASTLSEHVRNGDDYRLLRPINGD